jgi:hypothetical protein
MATIANTLYVAMVVHSAPEPGSVIMLLTAILTFLAYVRRKLKS